MDIIETLKGFGWMNVAIVLGTLGVLAYVWRDSLAGFLPKSGPSVPLPGTPVVGVDDDVADLSAAKRLQARFEKNKCPEGQAAVKVCLEHFFHTGAA